MQNNVTLWLSTKQVLYAMNYDKIKEALIELRDEAVGGNVFNTRYGICYNLMNKIEDCAFLFVASNSDDWEFYSGCTAYPVVEPYRYYGGCYWVGEQLELRLSLIDHLIKKCEVYND